MAMTYIRAKWQHTGRRGKSPRLIVIHCTVSSESGTGAEAVARYFQRGERRASAHRVSDSNSTVMCVPDENTAFGAAGVNNDGLHLELCGYPDQIRAEWLDSYSRAMFEEAGPTIREWWAENDIPLRWLSVAQVRDGVTRGLCTHADASLAFPEVSTGHWDPGPNFPKDVALRVWAGTMAPPPPPPVVPPLTTLESEDMFTYEYINGSTSLLVMVHGGKQMLLTGQGYLTARRDVGTAGNHFLFQPDEVERAARTWGAIVT